MKLFHHHNFLCCTKTHDTGSNIFDKYSTPFLKKELHELSHFSALMKRSIHLSREGTMKRRSKNTLNDLVIPTFILNKQKKKKEGVSEGGDQQKKM